MHTKSSLPMAVDVDKLVAGAGQAFAAGDLEAAVRMASDALKLWPGHSGALHMAGVVAYARGDSAEGERLILAAIAGNDRVAAYFANLALTFQAQGRAVEAESACRGALHRDPRLATAHNSLGTALQAQGRLAEAEVSYREALRLEPGYDAAAGNLGSVLYALDDYDAAEPLLRRALAATPTDAVCRVNLAALLKDTGRLSQAAGLLSAVLDADPDDAWALVNMGLVRTGQGDLDEAEALYRRALAVNPRQPLAAWNLALLLLESGRLDEGLALYEARFAAKPDPRFADPPLPLWTGAPLDGRTLLVWREQGLGDALMFGSVLPDLAAWVVQTGGRLVVAVDPRLVGLFARALGPGVEVEAAPLGPALPTFGADVHCPMGSLPGLLRSRLVDFPPAGGGWLAADPALTVRWRERLVALGPGLRVGVAWRSGVRTGTRARAYLDLADLRPLAAIPGLHLINLQHDLTAEETVGAAAALGAPLHVWSDADLRNDLETAAALTAACDLVIGVATSAGEMAAALGVPVWRLGGRDWTWLGTAARPWFPAMTVMAPQAGAPLADAVSRAAGRLRRLLPAAPVPSPDLPRLPDFAAKGRRCRQDGDLQNAARWFALALSVRPDDSAALAAVAEVLTAAGHPAGETMGRRALRLLPWNGAVLTNLALALSAAGALDAAALAWWMLILSEPGNGAGFAGLANVRAAQDRHPQALRGWARALMADPTQADWHYNHGNALRAVGRRVEADAAYRRAADCNPALALAAFNRGYVALERGDIVAGWEGLESRFAAGRAKPDRRFACPRWRGESLNGGDLLIWREQGIGDEIMFATVYADAIQTAKAAGAGRVVIDAEPRLAALLARSFPDAVVRPWRDGTEKPDGEGLAAHIPAGSLPGLLRRRLAEFPPDPALLVPDPAAVAHWRARFAAAGSVPALMVGICWRSGVPRTATETVLSTLADWEPVLTLPGVRVVNLQYDDCREEISILNQDVAQKIICCNDIDMRDDLDGVVALLASLDLVISAGTSVAELAAAVGTPVWRLSFSNEWAALGTAVRPWYPAQRLFRVPHGQTVADLLQDVARALRQLTPVVAALPPIPESKPAVTPAFQPEGPPAGWLAAGIERHRHGDLAGAAGYYQAVIDRQPRHADALHLLGMVLTAQGRPAAAVARFSQAIAVERRAPDYHANLAYALLALERVGEAEVAARRALKLRRDHAEAANTLGNALSAQARWAEAVGAYRTAVKARPGYAEAEANLGVALAALGQSAEAVPLLRSALGRLSYHIPARNALAAHWYRQGNRALALALYRQLIALQPAHGVAWEAMGQLTAAESCWRRAVRSAPLLPAPWGRWGMAARWAGDRATAARCFAALLSLEPGSADAVSNIGLLHQDDGAADRAEGWFARALAVDAAHGVAAGVARTNRALMRLARGDLADGWADYEGRLTAGSGVFPLALPYADSLTATIPPVWRGEELAGRHLLVWGEQGIGDELMFSALYPAVLAKAGRVTLACQPRLVGLFARSFPAARVVSLRDARRLSTGDIDFQIAAGSLPGVLTRRLSDFAGHAGGWLVPDSRLAETWAARVAGLGAGLKVGIAWTSRKRDQGRHRAYLDLAGMAPLFGLPGVRLLSLQYDGRFAEMAAVNDAFGAEIAGFPDADLLNDLETAAALTAACDVVVTTASSVGEMAGALGVPVWRLGGTDWTWLGTGVRPWYPTMRAIAPPAGGGLGDAVAVAARMLCRLSKPQAERIQES